MYKFFRTVFHWQYSQFFIGGLWAAAIAMLTDDRFTPTYVFFIFAGIWAVVYWQVSDHLTEMKADVQRRFAKVRKKPKSHLAIRALRKARIRYLLFNFGGSLTIIFVLVVCLRWTRSREIAYDLAQLQGWLVPAHDPDPAGCDARGDEVALYLGSNSIVTDDFPLTIVKIKKVPVLTLNRRKDGTIGIDLEIRGNDGRLIVKMNNDKFTINRNDYFSMSRRDLSSLTVVDQYGATALDARFLNPHSFRLVARFYSSGKLVNIEGMVSRTCVRGIKGAGISVFEF